MEGVLLSLQIQQAQFHYQEVMHLTNMCVAYPKMVKNGLESQRCFKRCQHANPSAIIVIDVLFSRWHTCYRGTLYLAIEVLMAQAS